MTVAAYLRVSTKKQAEHGISLDAQRHEVQAWAAREHPRAEVVEYIDDGYSGTVLTRPALEQLLGDLESINTVAVWRLDRWSREPVDRAILSDELRRHGVQLVSTSQSFDESPEGELMADLDGILAKYESRKIGLRTRIALRRKAERGELVTPSPYGYTDTWEVVAEEAEAIQTIDRRYLNEGLGGFAIAQHLNSLGIPSPTGGTWGRTSVVAVLERAVYAGIVSYGEWRWERHRRQERSEPVVTDVVAEAFKPIRSRETWEAICAERDRRRKEPGPRRKSIFGSVLHCGLCGSKMVFGGGRDRLYTCSRHVRDRSCAWNSLSERRLVKALLAEVADVSGEFEVATQGPDADRIERELATIDQRRQRLIAGYEAGALPLDDVGPRLDRLALRREDLEEQRKREPEVRTVSLAKLRELVDLVDDHDALCRWIVDVVGGIVWTKDTRTLEITWNPA